MLKIFGKKIVEIFQLFFMYFSMHTTPAYFFLFFIFYFWISKNLSARGRVPKKKITKPLGLSYFFFWYASGTPLKF